MADSSQVALLLLLLVPLGAAIIVALRGPEQRDSIRQISLAATLVCLLLALFLAGRFMSLPTQPTGSKSEFRFQPQFVPGSPAIVHDQSGRPQPEPHGTSWNLIRVGNTAVQFYIGVDGMNIWLILLTALLMVPSVLVSWEAIHERANEFYAWLLALEAAMIGVFVAFDILLFYAFFELTLIPLFFLIGIWGGGEKRYAAGKFFIYTLSGSLITLLGVLAVVLACYSQSNELTFSIPRLVWLVNTRLHEIPNERAFWYAIQFWVFLALIAGFSIKVPLVPLHTWLPLAHTEAPTAGSVLLAGVLLKIGSYGFLRLAIPLAPDAAVSVGMPLIGGLAAIGIVYGSLCAYAQTDIKKMVAYSSVSHLGLCMLGMFALNGAGLSGSMMVMLNHGLSTGLLFLLVGMLYERYHTREMSQYGGMASRLPLLAACMVFVCFTSVGLPGLNGFVGETLAIFGVVERHQQTSPLLFPYTAVAAVAGVVLGSWYLLTMLQRVFFGETKEPEVMSEHGHGAITDLKPREWAALAPLLVICVLIGVWPQPVLDTMRPALLTVEKITENARERSLEARGLPVVGLAQREEPLP
jgi:NADH-quinone oxidoreductase subunit M